MTNKQKNIVIPLLTVGITGTVCMLVGKASLIQVACPLLVVISVVINLNKGRSTGKLFLDGFIVLGIYMVFVLILAFMARENETIRTILSFPWHKYYNG